MFFFNTQIQHVPKLKAVMIFYMYVQSLLAQDKQ